MDNSLINLTKAMGKLSKHLLLYILATKLYKEQN